VITVKIVPESIICEAGNSIEMKYFLIKPIPFG